MSFDNILQTLDENGCPATSSLQILEPVEGKAVEEMGGSWRRFHVGNERCRLPVVPDTQTAFTGFNRPPFSFFSVYTALNCSSLQRFHLSLFAALLPASSQHVHIVNYDFCPFSTIPAALGFPCLISARPIIRVSFSSVQLSATSCSG